MSDREAPQAAGRLSPEGAFVVQFGAHSDPAVGRAAGRVEHVRSGRAARFASVADLLAFISRVLAEVPPR
jgi:hypothetical protein